MKTIFKSTLLFFCLCFFVNNSFAQEEGKDYSIDFDASLFSRHLWRGGQAATSPCLESTLGFSKKGFSIGAWVAYSLDKEYTEVDFFIGYSLTNVSLTIYDYYCYKDGKDNDNDFYKIGKENTSSHAFDAVLKINGGENERYSNGSE